LQVQVVGRNLEITEALRQYVEKKLSRFDRYFYRPLQAQVRLRVEKGRHICEVTIPLDGLILRGEESSEDLYASIDQVLDKLERQIHKHKTRINRKNRRENRLREAAAAPVIREEVEPSPEERWEVVREKTFPAKPMDVEEAILQMNLLGHDFFVFRDADTNEVHVVYRRKEGGYGLIRPE